MNILFISPNINDIIYSEIFCFPKLTFFSHLLLFFCYPVALRTVPIPFLMRYRLICFVLVLCDASLVFHEFFKFLNVVINFCYLIDFSLSFPVVLLTTKSFIGPLKLFCCINGLLNDSYDFESFLSSSFNR